MNAPHRDAGFFTESLESRDPEIFAAIEKELGRQRDEIELIASENIVSAAVMAAQGSVMTNKYAEGIPGAATMAAASMSTSPRTSPSTGPRRCSGCDFANVQPNSGSQANQGVFQALLTTGRHDPRHEPRRGRAPDPRRETQPVGQVVQRHPVRRAPAGQTAGRLRPDRGADRRAQTEDDHRRRLRHPAEIDFAKMREIADSVGAYLLVDMAHFAGLVAAGHYPSPFPHAHVATTTTHKTLRGPRGGMILTNDEALAKKVNSAIFPGIQGGPLMHVIAAKAVAFGEALRPEFKDYQAQVIKNAQALADQLMKGGLDIVTGGTDTHLMLVDLRPKGVKGNATEKALGRAHITCNKNGIPFDTEKADDHLRRPPRLARRHHARLRRGRVPPDRRLDRRGGRRAGRERRGRQRRDRGQGGGRGA
jgi:glycine hydroxymethyltransferase